MLYWMFKYILLGPWLRLLYRPQWRVWRTSPDDGPAILASNRLSFSDSIFLPLVCKRHITFLAKAEYFTCKGIKGWSDQSVHEGRRPGADRSVRGADAALEHREAGAR